MHIQYENPSENYREFIEDFIGKIIENHFYNMYQEYVSFVGFKKEHPTKKEAYIYIKYKTEQDEANIVNQFIELVQFLNRIIISIQKEFSTKS